MPGRTGNSAEGLEAGELAAMGPLESAVLKSKFVCTCMFV